MHISQKKSKKKKQQQKKFVCRIFSTPHSTIQHHHDQKIRHDKNKISFCHVCRVCNQHQFVENCKANKSIFDMQSIRDGWKAKNRKPKKKKVKKKKQSFFLRILSSVACTKKNSSWQKKNFFLLRPPSLQCRSTCREFCSDHFHNWRLMTRFLFGCTFFLGLSPLFCHDD